MKYRAILGCVAFAAVLGNSNFAWSGTASGTVSYIYYQSDGTVFIEMTGVHNGAPACAAGYTRWALSASTPAGQGMLATLLTFYAQGKAFNINGKGNCDVWSDTESIAGLYF